VNSYTRRGVHGQVVREIASRVLSGAYPEGATIDVSTLEDELGVSRTVVREALKVLTAKGLVDARQKRGTYVLQRARWNLLDADVLAWQFAGRSDESFLDQLHEMRAIVEPAGAGLAAGRRTPADLAAIDAAVEQMVRAEGDPDAAVAADLAFHRALLAATHNELLTRMEMLLETGLASRDRLVHTTSPHDDPVPSHRAVADAIRDGDAERAAAAMSQLLDKALADLRRAREGNPP
jgi:DNA-binding FadR family transcriptional regulator